MGPVDTRLFAQDSAAGLRLPEWPSAAVLAALLELQQPLTYSVCLRLLPLPLLAKQGHALRLQLTPHGTLPLLVYGSPTCMHFRLHTAQHQLKVLFSCKPLGLHNKCVWHKHRCLLHHVQALL